MVWGCMTSAGFGQLVRIKGNMDAAQYCRILQKGLLGTFDNLGLDPQDFIFQQDNNPKHTSHRPGTGLRVIILMCCPGRPTAWIKTS